MVANETVGGARAPRRGPRARRRARRARARRLPGAQHAAPALGLRRGRRARGGAGAARREPRCDARGRPRRDGEIGDGDPIQAIEDALRTFRPDELIISTHPLGPLALARARRRREGPRAVRPARSPTSSSISMLEAPVLTVDQVDPLPLAPSCATCTAPPSVRERCPTSGRATGCRRTLQRDDFVFLVARDGCELAGFGYGYTGAYGHWWTEHVARGADRRPARAVARPAALRDRRAARAAVLAAPRRRQRAARAAAEPAAARPSAALDADRVAEGAQLLREERLDGARRASTSARPTRPTSCWGRTWSASAACLTPGLPYFPATLET